MPTAAPSSPAASLIANVVMAEAAILITLLPESLAVATRSGAPKPADFTKVVVDTTVQPKAAAHL